MIPEFVTSSRSAGSSIAVKTSSLVPFFRKLVGKSTELCRRSTQQPYADPITSGIVQRRVLKSQTAVAIDFHLKACDTRGFNEQGHLQRIDALRSFRKFKLDGVGMGRNSAVPFAEPG